MTELSPEDSAHLIAAMCRLAAQGDHESVKKLAALAKEPERLREIMNGASMQTQPEESDAPMRLTSEQIDFLDKLIDDPRYDLTFKDRVFELYGYPPWKDYTPEERKRMWAEYQQSKGAK